MKAKTCRHLQNQDTRLNWFFLIKCMNSAMKPQLRSLEVTSIQAIKPQWCCHLPCAVGTLDPSTPVNFDLQEHTCSLLGRVLSCSHSMNAALCTPQTENIRIKFQENHYNCIFVCLPPPPPMPRSPDFNKALSLELASQNTTRQHLW